MTSPSDQIVSSAAPEDEERYFSDFQAAEGGPEGALLFWTLPPCLVTTTRTARSPQFAAARKDSEARGWPVLLRRSGGGTVFHGPGVLCVTRMHRVAREELSLQQAYSDFCALLVRGLARLGLDCTVGSMPGAPCDGRYNILFEGRKIAGTAARFVPRAGSAAVLTHASLVVAGECESGIAAVAAFERGLGLPGLYRTECMASIAECGSTDDLELVACTIRKTFIDKVARPARSDRFHQLKEYIE